MGVSPELSEVFDLVAKFSHSTRGGIDLAQTCVRQRLASRQFLVIAKGLFSGGINVRFFRAFTRIIEGRRP